MCGNLYLEQRPAFVAPLALRLYAPRRARSPLRLRHYPPRSAYSSNRACPPQEEALILRGVHSSRPRNQVLQVTNHASRSTNHQSLLKNHASLIASREILKIRLSCSRRMNKLF
jgi:hypothetical protein